jgi:hypothetical protein
VTSNSWKVCKLSDFSSDPRRHDPSYNYFHLIFLKSGLRISKITYVGQKRYYFALSPDLFFWEYPKVKNVFFMSVSSEILISFVITLLIREVVVFHKKSRVLR